jgi:shikimate kinase
MKIYLIGFMGCGKTHWAKLLSEKFSVPFFDLDKEVESVENKTIVQIFSEEGEEYFRAVEKEVLYRLSYDNENFVMACGGGTPCFYNNIDFMKRMGTPVWIHCSIDCLHERLLNERSERPLIKNLSDKQLKSYIIKKFSDRKIFYQQAPVTVNEDNISLDILIDKIFHNDTSNV